MNYKNIFFLFLLTLFCCINSEKEKSSKYKNIKKPSGVTTTNQQQIRYKYYKRVKYEAVKRDNIYSEMLKYLMQKLCKLPSDIIGKDGYSELNQEEKKAYDDLEIKINDYKLYVENYRKKDKKGKRASIRLKNFFVQYMDRVRKMKFDSDCKVQNLHPITEYKNLEEYLCAISKLETANDLNLKIDDQTPWGSFIECKIKNPFDKLNKISNAIFKKNKENNKKDKKFCDMSMDEGLKKQQMLFDAIFRLLKAKEAKLQLTKKIQKTDENTRVVNMINHTKEKIYEYTVKPFVKIVYGSDLNCKQRPSPDILWSKKCILRVDKLIKAYENYCKAIQKYIEIDPQGEALKYVIVKINEKGKKSIPIFGGMLKVYLLMTSINKLIDPRRKKNKNISEMLSDEKIWKYNISNIKKVVGFAVGINRIANIFNRVHNQTRPCKIVGKDKDRCNALKKGMNELYTVSQKELELGSAILNTIRDCQKLTVQAYLNKIIIN